MTWLKNNEVFLIVAAHYKICQQKKEGEFLINRVGYGNSLEGTQFPCRLKQILAVSWHVAVKVLAYAYR